jgi:hypothetical protein
LAIIWNRIKNESKEIGVYHPEESKISHEEQPEGWISLLAKQNQVHTIWQCDFETFIIFSRRFMDKVAELIELMIEYPNEKRPGEGFTKHKKWFIEHSEIHPVYSEFLKNKAYWYNQELLLLRDMVIAHSGTLTSGAIVSPRTGAGFRKSYGISRLQGLDKDEFLLIKREYEKRCSSLRIPENDFEMMNDFRREIRKYDIRLDDPHLGKILGIAKKSGARLDGECLEFIASHIEDFLRATASIFRS